MNGTPITHSHGTRCIVALGVTEVRWAGDCPHPAPQRPEGQVRAISLYQSVMPIRNPRPAQHSHCVGCMAREPNLSLNIGHLKYKCAFIACVTVTTRLRARPSPTTSENTAAPRSPQRHCSTLPHNKRKYRKNSTYPLNFTSRLCAAGGRPKTREVMCHTPPTQPLNPSKPPNYRKVSFRFTDDNGDVDEELSQYHAQLRLTDASRQTPPGV